MSGYEKLKERYLDKLSNTSLAEIAEHYAYEVFDCDYYKYIEIPILVLRRHMLCYCECDNYGGGKEIAMELKRRYLNKIVKYDDDRMIRIVKTNELSHLLGINWKIEILDKYLNIDIIKDTLKYDVADNSIDVRDFENVSISINEEHVNISLSGNKKENSDITDIKMTVKDNKRDVIVTYKNGDVISSGNTFLYEALNNLKL